MMGQRRKEQGRRKRTVQDAACRMADACSNLDCEAGGTPWHGGQEAAQLDVGDET